MKSDFHPIRITRQIQVACQIQVASIMAAVLVLLSGCSTQASTTETTIPVATNQKLVSGQIVSILGNEVTLVIQDTSSQTATGETTATAAGNNDQSGAQAAPSGQTANSTDSGTSGNTPPAGAGSGTRTRPTGSGSGTRTRPSGSGSGSGNWTKSGGSTSGTSNGSTSGTTGGSASSSSGTPSATQQTMDFMIPVGTKVTTAQGVVTTFSRLAAGNSVKVLFETAEDGTSVVVGVWILEN